MDPSGMFQSGFTIIPQQNSHLVHAQAQAQGLQMPLQPPLFHRDDASSETESNPHRVAHTLTACTRCRQRKTRCDPSLPRCLPCERSGSICEYYDTAKGKKISRHYVIVLQDKVRQLEADLKMLTEEEGDFPRNNETMMREGGHVRLSMTDEALRYLGPSSGIAMPRLLMEEAKLFTDSKRISELIPEVRARRERRMQSIVMTGNANKKKCIYPMFSDIPAPSLPSRPITNQLWEAFSSKAQMFWPIIHEPTFIQDLDDVYNGTDDPYKKYVVRMVIAIGLQKNDPQYAGLADSYYQAAMQIFEDVVRPRDLKSLQCLLLLAIYSILTPSRMAIYFVLGLATRICQGMGMTYEKTISRAYNQGLEGALTLDLRRRLFWVVASMEFGLAHTMGRPSGLAQTDDLVDVQLFETVEDKYITEDGILPGPTSEKKQVAIHLLKMRLLQAEIRRTLYETKRSEPTSDEHPWFEAMEQKLLAWMDESPKKPEWCIPWFSGRYQGMRIILRRPSPQVTRPSDKAVEICYDSAAHIVNLSRAQMEKGAVDLTWIFLLNLYMCINTLLWCVSYAHIRQAHAREDIEELVDTTLDMLEQCTERWPGTQSAVNLYSVLSRACLQVYDVNTPMITHTGMFDTPYSMADTSPPPQAQNRGPFQQSFGLQPHFNSPFGQQSDMNMFHDVSFGQQNMGSAGQRGSGIGFRSNSIFQSGSSGERRFSHWAPEDGDENTPPATTTPGPSSPPDQAGNSLPSPPESLPPRSSPGLRTPVQVASHPTTPSRSPVPVPPVSNMPPPSSQKHATHVKMEQTTPRPPNRNPTFSVQPSQASIPQQPLPPPTTISNWFSPPAPILSPFTFNLNAMNTSLFGMDLAHPPPPNSGGFHGGSGQGGFGGLPGSNVTSPLGSQFNMHWQRQGSLSQEQHSELMQELESSGLGDLDFFSASGPPPAAPTTQPIQWS